MTDPNLRRLLDIAKGEGNCISDISHFAFIDKKNSIGDSFGNSIERDEYCRLQENILKDL